MRQALYPKEQYPQGHPELAKSLSDLGNVLEAQGTYGEARDITSGLSRCTSPFTPRSGHPQGTPTSLDV